MFSSSGMCFILKSLIFSTKASFGQCLREVSFLIFLPLALLGFHVYSASFAGHILKISVFLYFWLCRLVSVASRLFCGRGEQGLLASCDVVAVSRGCILAAVCRLLQGLLLVPRMGSRAHGLQSLLHVGSMVAA